MSVNLFHLGQDVSDTIDGELKNFSLNENIWIQK